MKLIQKGRDQAGWSREARCTGKGNGRGGCGAKVLVEQPDLYRTFQSHYDGSTDHFVTFMCVECGVETDIEVPGSIELVLPTKGEWRNHPKAPAAS